MIKNIQPRLCEIGKIKIGGKGRETTTKSGKKMRLPVKYDHFVITKTTKDSDDNFEVDKDLMAQLGGKPKELSIRLLFDDIDLNFQTSYSCYKGKKCFCRGDGEKAMRINDETGIRKEISCIPEECEYKQKGYCKISGILSCLLPQASRIGGVYKLRTHSYNSVVNVLSALQFLSLATNGMLFNLPLKLELIEKETEEHGKIKVVNIAFDGNMDQLNNTIVQEKQRRLSGNIDVKKIEEKAVNSGLLEDNEEDEEIENEFYTKTNNSKGNDAEDVKAKLKHKEKENVKKNDNEDLF